MLIFFFFLTPIFNLFIKTFLRYSPSDFHRKIECGGKRCKKSFGFHMYHASERALSELKRTVKAAFEARAKTVEQKYVSTHHTYTLYTSFIYPLYTLYTPSAEGLVDLHKEVREPIILHPLYTFIKILMNCVHLCTPVIYYMKIHHTYTDTHL